MEHRYNVCSGRPIGTLDNKAPVVQKVNNAFHRINLYLLDSDLSGG